MIRLRKIRVLYIRTLKVPAAGLPLPELAAEELLEKGIAEEFVKGRLPQIAQSRVLLHHNLHHSRAGLFHDRRKGLGGAIQN